MGIKLGGIVVGRLFIRCSEFVIISGIVKYIKIRNLLLTFIKV